ncbi:hypothetical protein ANO14919_094750 [Xylariales sp. No.14919]|nr:hypothetical protein ANO14919_094750 [Xylariales sp. No.14919]
MTQYEAPEPGYHSRRNTRYQLPRVPVTPAVGPQGQPQRSCDTISQSNREESKYKDECSHPKPERHMGKGTLTDKTSIGQSLYSGPPRTPARLSLTSFPEYLAPKPTREMFNSLQIGTHNLSSENQVLRSNSTPSSLESVAESPPQSDKVIKAQNRKFAIYERVDSRSILLRGPEPLKDLLARHPQGQIISTQAWRATLERLPSSDTRETNKESKIEEIGDYAIPVIRLTPPPEGDVQQVDLWRLSTNDAYKSLYEKSERENRTLKRILPLVWLTAEAEGLDTYDAVTLEYTLRGIIEDRQRLLPLAAILCADQGIEFDTEAFEALPSALEKILKDAERAKFAAGHHKRARKQLESRMGRLENELLRFRNDVDEDYVR